MTLTPHLVIRPADPADYDCVIAKVDAWWSGRQMAAMLPRLFFTHFRPWTTVADRSGDLVGFLAAFQSQTDPAQVYSHFIGVDPDHRGEGIGHQLYTRLFADAAGHGCREVLAVTSPRNRPSVAFHRRLGFDLLPGLAETDGIPYIPAYDGPDEDRVRFRKPLCQMPSNAIGVWLQARKAPRPAHGARGWGEGRPGKGPRR